MNIVDVLWKLLAQSGIGKQLAASLGLGEEKVESGIKAALPALLAALAGAASTKEGAQKLASAVEGADDGILGNLGGIFRNQETALADQGNSMLESILSGSPLGSLSSVLSRFTGLGSGSATTLLGTLAPVVLGLLKRETRASGFDPASLTRLLDSQKENILKALPGGLAGMLGEIPGLGNLSAMTQRARDTVGSAANQAGRAASATLSEGAGAVKWLVPLLAALALGFLAWNYWLKPAEPKPVAARMPVETRPVDTRPQTVTAARLSADVARQIENATTSAQQIFTDATTALSSVDDAESAEKAAARIPALTERLRGLKDSIDSIPESQQQTILQSIRKLRTTLLALIDRISSVPGVSNVLEPQMAKLKTALDAFGP